MRTIDRCGHLMDGLDNQTATRLDAIAATVRGPRPTRGVPLNAQTLQLRPDLIRRYRLELPYSVTQLLTPPTNNPGASHTLDAVSGLENGGVAFWLDLHGN